MKTTVITIAVAALALCTAPAQVPSILNYQGRVTVGGTNLTTNAAQFKFALVDSNGTTVYWKNDGTTTTDEPANAVSVAVSQGLYSTLLGDTALANMAALPSSVFTNADVNLRVWFSPGSGNPFVQLAPDQRLGASGYALRAAAVDLPGENNTASGTFAVVGGGVQNAASGYIATIGGGVNNTASGSYAVVGGGETNTASGSRATIGGGSQNTATGSYATVPGGVRSFATNFGAFVWSGDVFEDTGSFGNNTFTVRAEGGARFYTANGTATGVNLSAGAGAWNNLSDRRAKANFRKVDATAVLAKVAAMPVMTWNYRTQDESIRHIGPTAQDFRAAFGLGENDKTISTIDPSGVALAAIQGLVEELKLRDKTIEELKAKLDAVEQRLESFPPAP